MIRKIGVAGYHALRAKYQSILQTTHIVSRKAADRYAKYTAQIRGNAVPAYWYRRVRNFGDFLTPLLLKHYGFSPYYTEEPITGSGEAYEIVGVGSIIQMLHTEFKGVILGSGLIYDKPKSMPNALFLAVRGELTKKLCACPDSVILGDPGLLVDRLIRTPGIPKKYRIGIIPHRIECDHQLFEEKFELRKDTTLIDPRRHPHDVIRKIAECEYIASSSLHGLIIADSLGIPCVRILMSKGLIVGDDFKFNDYYSSIGIQHEKIFVDKKISAEYLIGQTNSPSNDVLEERKRGLHELFLGLNSILEQRRQAEK